MLKYSSIFFTAIWNEALRAPTLVFRSSDISSYFISLKVGIALQTLGYAQFVVIGRINGDGVLLFVQEGERLVDGYAVEPCG